MKEHLGKPPILSKPTTGEVLSLYLEVSEHAVSSVLVREENKVQLPVYYTSKCLLDTEMRYPQMEKLALVLVVTSRKLCHYFQVHSIQVLTNHRLRQVLQKPDTSKRLLKWSIELSQFDIDYKPQIAIKGQALAEFVAEFMGVPDEAKVVGGPLKWKLYVDGSSNDNDFGAGLVLHTPEGHKITSAVRFEFPASNNEVEYDALLAGLRLTEHLKVEAIDIFSNSQLVVNQVKGQYQTRDEKMAAYLKKVKKALEKLTAYDIQQVSRAENSNAEALARLATSNDAELLKLVPVEALKAPSTKGKLKVMSMSCQPSWRDPIIRYLVDSELPEDKQQAKKLKGQSLAYKVLRKGYYWPDLKKEVAEYAKKREGCQRYALIPQQHSEDLTSIVTPWPFAKWGIDLIGPLHKTPGGYKYTIVAIDYFMKWVEAEPLTTISEEKCIHKNFFSIVYPQSNGQVKAMPKRQLDSYKGKWADELPKVLWAYRTTSRTTKGETTFSMGYGVEAVLPVEISIPTSRVIWYEEGVGMVS
ncbi:uncharacterized protein LOC112091128 [Morus notabilis]|uniref:uncharacterized protein LOC112091128 n=1 Tax=Morus notabilis TaxID=981085 RepID=UPI000CED58F9|nr:uncharacterized protein LOC112091128 [Morus notabilis]